MLPLFIFATELRKNKITANVAYFSSIRLTFLFPPLIPPR